MDDQRSLVDACRAVGLDCRCEHLHAEPRFRICIDQKADPPRLRLSIRNDDSIVPRPIHADIDVPAILFEVAEETVRREPTMNLWLPCTDHHRYVVWHEDSEWKAGKLAPMERIETAAEAVRAVRKPAGDDAAPTCPPE